MHQMPLSPLMDIVGFLVRDASLWKTAAHVLYGINLTYFIFFQAQENIHHQLPKESHYRSRRYPSQLPIQAREVYERHVLGLRLRLYVDSVP